MDISTFIKQSSNICIKVSYKYKCFVANGLTLPKLLLQSFQLFYTEMKINFLQTALVKLNLLASAISWWGDSGAEPSVLFSLLLNSRPWGIFIPLLQYVSHIQPKSQLLLSDWELQQGTWFCSTKPTQSTYMLYLSHLHIISDTCVTTQSHQTEI